MTGPLDGQVAVVTGAGKGLGRAFALDLAARGAAVVVNNRARVVDDDGRSAADYVVDEITAAGGAAVADHGAVEDPQTGPRLVRTALERWGRLDICVTSAGIANPQMFHRTTPESLAEVLAVNVTGTALVAAAASAAMREEGGGRVLLVASTAGLWGEPTVSAYAASKGAIIALGRTAAVEGERRGVLTNVLLPYATTQMTEAGMDPRFAEAMTAAAVAPLASALVDPRSRLNGQVVVAGAGGMRVADSVELGTVRVPPGPLEPEELQKLVAESRAGTVHTYPEAQAAFADFAADVVEN